MSCFIISFDLQFVFDGFLRRQCLPCVVWRRNSPKACFEIRSVLGVPARQGSWPGAPKEHRPSAGAEWDFIAEIEREVTIRFDQRKVVYDFGELDEISLAYAITVHKSQGSEFPAVVIPLAIHQDMLLQRNLVYTGMTRRNKLVVLVGQRKTLAMAVKNNRTENRFSGLLARLLAPG